VALRPESFTFFTPDCAVKTELVLLPTPHPLPETVTMYTGTVVAAAGATGGLAITSGAFGATFAGVAGVSLAGLSDESDVSLSASLHEARKQNADPNEPTATILVNCFNFIIV